jgi:hypothetical protein
VITGRDGRGEHLYFRLGAHKVRNSAGLMGPGIDIRGTGGYVLLPPSVHPSGRVYHRSVDSADDVATAPDWLHQIVDDKQNGERGPHGKQTLDYWNALFESEVAEGEGRHEAVIKVAGKLHHCGAAGSIHALSCHQLVQPALLQATDRSMGRVSRRAVCHPVALEAQPWMTGSRAPWRNGKRSRSSSRQKRCNA